MTREQADPGEERPGGGSSAPMALGKSVGLILGLARCCGQLAGDVASVQRSSALPCGPSKPSGREVGPIC